MKRLLIATTALTLLLAPISAAFAQDRDNNRHDDNRGGNSMMMQGRDNGRQDNYRGNNGQHRGWYKGGRIERNDWDRGQRVNDYRRYHLQRPPRGYEWRRVDNNYILAAAATGLIAGLVLANH
ncbi:MAG TPA: RcnB family protein [Rhizomicrobium sp.]|nr:RcnB family protein [Rhizomicrobium sp.]